jgi:hypothetical protein
MITIENILEWAKPHPNKVTGARMLRIYNDDIEASIVGGGTGLYGDFVKSFELAIFNRETDDFITKFFFPENQDDVVGYLEGEKLVEFLNNVFRNDFQVR